jgi:hypothetical protein
MPGIASHVGARRGRFLVGVVWIDAVFAGDPEAVPGAKKNRAFRWVSSSESNTALAELAVRKDAPLPVDW